MAKNTKEGALKTEALVLQTITDIFMQQGWDAITYGSIAKRTGLSRSGVQRIVPSKESMTRVFQSQIFSYIVSQLDDSSKKTLRETWLISLDDPKFVNCIRYLMGAAHAEFEGKSKVEMILNSMFQKYGEENVTELLGLSLVSLIHKKPTFHQV